MQKTKYQKIIDYSPELYNKILKLKEERDEKRKTNNYVNKKELNIIHMDKKSVFQRVKKYLNIDDEGFNYILENKDNYLSSLINALGQEQNIEDLNKFWFADYTMDKWLITNMLCQFNESFVYSFLIDYFKNKKIKLMDYACGTATLAFSLLDKLNIEKLDLFELDNYIAAYLKQNCNKKVNYFNILEDEINDQYDAILNIDVLEHLENSTETLIKMHNALKEKGILVLHAPFELDDPSHIPEAADDFFNNKGFEFLNKNFELIHDRQNDFLISAIYQKK